MLVAIRAWLRRPMARLFLRVSMPGQWPLAGFKAVTAITSPTARDFAHKSNGPTHGQGLSGSMPSWRSVLLVHAGPGLAATEHAAKGAALHVQSVWPLHRECRIVGAAAVWIQDTAAPFLVLA